MMKRVLILALSIIMAISLAACSKTKDNTNENQNPNTNQEEQTPNIETFDLKEVYEGVALKDILSRKMQIAPYLMDTIEKE